MLIYIESVTQDDVFDEKNFVAIENILRAFAEKKHIILAPKTFFNDIINEKQGLYSISTKNFAAEALAGLREYHAIKNIVSFYVSIDFSIKDESYSWVDLGGKDKFVCGPLFFNDSECLQRTNVVCENPLDSDFMKIIADYYARRESLSRCTISYNVLHGGGGSTKDVFDRTVNDNKITFCVVDNDKDHPRAPYGGTSTHFLRERTSKTGMVKILDVHEIESLLPLETIEHVLEEENLLEKKKGALRFLKDLCNIDETVKFYYDHKKGFNLKDAWKLDNTHGEYWRRIIGKLGDAYKCDCLSSRVCTCKPSCLTYDGFGEGLLNNTIRYVNRGSLRQYNPMLTPELSEKWNDLGRNFFSWSCGPYKKSRVS
ncbi:hypothetical protein SMZ81_003586 [Cronobacter sakazakii]|nr:hypothetical protein [Cronobacter sakazakii]